LSLSNTSICSKCLDIDWVKKKEGWIISYRTTVRIKYQVRFNLDNDFHQPWLIGIFIFYISCEQKSPISIEEEKNIYSFSFFYVTMFWFFRWWNLNDELIHSIVYQYHSMLMLKIRNFRNVSIFTYTYLLDNSYRVQYNDWLHRDSRHWDLILPFHAQWYQSCNSLM
jgi:hypothetical protein